MATISTTDRRSTRRRVNGRPDGERPASMARQSLSLLRSALELPLCSYYLVAGAAGLLIALGMMMVLSSSSVYAYVNYGDSYYFVKRQIIFLMVGLLAAFVLSRLSLRKLRLLGWAGIAVAFLLLILTYTPLGVTVNGNRNWLDLGSSMFRIQPSEFAKVAIVVWGADILARKDKLLSQPRHVIVPYLPVTCLLILLVVFQGDLGTSIVMCGMVVGVLFVLGVPLRLFGMVLALAAGMVALLIRLSPNRMGRIAAFLQPGTDLLGTNMQPMMGLYAIASGGWWGLGLGASRQKWGSLSEAHTDYIFAVVGEELGLFGTLAVLALFLVLGYAGVRIAMRADNPFCRYAAAGVTTWLMFQAVLNIAVVLRLMPVMGVPLPLLSYGGSALLADLMALGILLACARHEPAARALLAHDRPSAPSVSAVTDAGPRRTASSRMKSTRTPGSRTQSGSHAHKARTR